MFVGCLLLCLCRVTKEDFRSALSAMAQIDPAKCTQHQLVNKHSGIYKSTIN